ncbi:MAG: carboxypeptidase-like regulatory domain-containing protein [Candidatus Scalindua rubra]|uniref:Cna protein B-type domain protein n=1 Tax=Candidatus Scalindua brodae TaxID=237368 RepID=A0A0B0EI25_9BACT|nr:MAG: hypothetical protein SCABRO_01525 [Candidatus Scalindua brodae]MBZ0108341.1 carboxypeptidase-like regulatory domain-containing protein [Candidatus Scalindua rubra]TWU34039.1 hypothetical protein S225a_12960 [Candidatus Brocadiaceae bacterium S225]
MLRRSYVFRLVIVCALGMLPFLGHSGSVFAANVGIIQGKVTGQRTNAAVRGVDIQITDLQGKVVKNVKSRQDGTFTVSQVPTGQYNVKAGDAPAKSIQIAMSPPVTQVDFQVPEKGYTVFAGTGMSAGMLAIVGVSAAAAIAGIVIAVDAKDDADDNEDEIDDLRRQLASP